MPVESPRNRLSPRLRLLAGLGHATLRACLEEGPLRMHRRCRPARSPPGSSGFALSQLALSQLAWAHEKAVVVIPWAPSPRASPHTREHVSRKKRECSRVFPRVVGDMFQRPSTTLHLVWGRVVPDIPDFCRELVAALA